MRLRSNGFGWLPWVVLGTSLGCHPGPQGLIKSYSQAVSSGDVDRVMTLYAPNITFEMVGAWLKSGSLEARALADWDRILQTRLAITGCIPSGRRWVCQATESNAWLKAAGLPQVRYKVVFVIDDQRISRIRATMEPADSRQVRSFLIRIKSWLAKNRPEMLNLLMPEGKLRHGEQPANLWLGLLRAYRPN